MKKRVNNAKKNGENALPEGSVEFRVPSDPRILKIIRAGISHLCELSLNNENVVLQKHREKIVLFQKFVL
jgi:hypothetical protein